MRTKPLPLLLAASLAAVGLASASGASDQAHVPPVSEWNYDALYKEGGIRAENLLGARVLGSTGEEIGSVENVVADANGKIVGIIAQVGGLRGVGDDTHVPVPFNEIAFSDGGVKVPINEENVDEFDLFGDRSFISQEALEWEASAQGDRWKVTTLLSQYAVFTDHTAYGHVDDVLFSRSGQVQAIVVEKASGYPSQHFAYPFDPRAGEWVPEAPALALPYGKDAAQQLQPFDYDRYESVLQ